MSYDINNFDWGWMNESDLGHHHKNCIINEIFNQKVYERFFEVEENDVVVDMGASVGPFIYTIQNKNPKFIYCIEPSQKEIPTLMNNLTIQNSKIIEKAISNRTGLVRLKEVFGSNGQEIELDSISFMDFISENDIKKIDFLKTDCEGGEYDVFNRENIWWIKENVKKIAGEWHLHLGDVNLVEKFREFRDIYLKLFPNHQVFSLDGVDIKWDLWNENFLNYYRHIIIYIDNRK